MIKTLLTLMWEFVKTGLLSVGGGMATIPFLGDMADTYGWFTRVELANIIAVAESTPGPIGVNAATYVGYVTMSRYGYLWGILGGVASTLCLVAPEIAVITLVAKGLAKYKSSRVVENVFYALRPTAAGLIAAAGFSVVKTALNLQLTLAPWSFAVDWRCLILFAAFVGVMCIKKLKNVHPLVFLAAGGLLGALLKL